MKTQQKKILMNLDDWFSFDKKVKKAEEVPKSKSPLKLAKEKRRKNILPVSSGPRCRATRKEVTAPKQALIKLAIKLTRNLFL